MRAIRIDRAARADLDAKVRERVDRMIETSGMIERHGLRASDILQILKICQVAARRKIYRRRAAEIAGRMAEGISSEELADAYGISASRVRDIAARHRIDEEHHDVD